MNELRKRTKEQLREQERVMELIRRENSDNELEIGILKARLQDSEQ